MSPTAVRERGDSKMQRLDEWPAHLAAMIASAPPLTIVYNEEPRPDQRALMATLGVHVVVTKSRPAGVVESADMETPAQRATETRDCVEPGCTNERRYDRGVGAGRCEYHGKPLFQAHGARVGKLQPRAARPRPLPDGTPLNKQAVELGKLGTRVESAARRKARASRTYDEASAALTAALDQYTAQLRESIERARALRDSG